MPTIQLTNAPFIDKNFIVTGAFGEIRSGGSVHRGLDLAPYGYAGDLYAIDHFKLMYKGYDADGYGNYAIFTNENNMMYLYAHMASLPSKNVGDTYNIHEYIAPAGTTGSSTGVHLHLEMQTGTSWQYSQPITRYTNPCDYLIGIINVVSSSNVYYYDGSPTPPTPTPSSSGNSKFKWVLYARKLRTKHQKSQ